MEEKGRLLKADLPFVLHVLPPETETLPSAASRYQTDNMGCLRQPWCIHRPFHCAMNFTEA